MSRVAAEPVTIIATEGELPPRRRVWGTGAWFSPDAREALDWLTLSRRLGWGVCGETLWRDSNAGGDLGTDGAPGRAERHSYRSASMGLSAEAFRAG
jgi:hypothetical protein